MEFRDVHDSVPFENCVCERVSILYNVETTLKSEQIVVIVCMNSILLRKKKKIEDGHIVHGEDCSYKSSENFYNLVFQPHFVCWNRALFV